MARPRGSRPCDDRDLASTAPRSSSATLASSTARRRPGSAAGPSGQPRARALRPGRRQLLVVGPGPQLLANQRQCRHRRAAAGVCVQSPRGLGGAQGRRRRRSCATACSRIGRCGRRRAGEAFAWLVDVLRTLCRRAMSCGRELSFASVSTTCATFRRSACPTAWTIPVLHASAGIRRVLALSYLLVWSWQEHHRASEQLDQPSTRQVIFLIDEIEAHLHPRWQRQIVKPLLDIVESLADHAAEVQIIAATHSPLVPASMEPLFDPERDAWFDLDLAHDETPPRVVLQRRPFIRRGDAASWLTSDAFDLKEARSLEAEEAIQQALALLRGERPRDEASRIDAALRATLGSKTGSGSAGARSWRACRAPHDPRQPRARAARLRSAASVSLGSMPWPRWSGRSLLPARDRSAKRSPIAAKTSPPISYRRTGARPSTICRAPITGSALHTGLYIYPVTGAASVDHLVANSSEWFQCTNGTIIASRARGSTAARA